MYFTQYCIILAVTTIFLVGLTMFRLLPRHMFGYVQSKLFPKYFLLGTVLSSVSMVTFIIEHPFGSWDTQQTIQV